MGIHVKINPTKDGKFRAKAGHEFANDPAGYGDTPEAAFYDLVVYQITSRIYVQEEREVVDPKPSE